MARRKIVFFAFSTLAIVGASWGVGYNARVAVSRWVSFETVPLHASARGLYPCRNGSGRNVSWTAQWPMAIDQDGNVLAFFACAGGIIARYNISHHTWLPGYVFDTGEFSPIPATQQRVWLFRTYTHQSSLVMAKFERGRHSFRPLSLISLPQMWRNAMLLTAVGAPGGKAVVTGWIPNAQWKPGTGCQYGTPSWSEACWSHGSDILAVARPESHTFAVTRLPASFPPSAVSVGGTTVWTAVSQPCRLNHAGSACRKFILVRHNLRTGSTNALPLPPSLLPRGGHVWSLSSLPDGTPWLVTTRGSSIRSGLELATVHGSHFVETPARFSESDLFGTPLVDKNADLWFPSFSGALVVNPRTGHATSEPKSQTGELMQGSGGSMYWVTPGIPFGLSDA